jgi:hypothetical protein
MSCRRKANFLNRERRLSAYDPTVADRIAVVSFEPIPANHAVSDLARREVHMKGGCVNRTGAIQASSS